MYIAPKSTNESRAHYAPDPHGVHKQLIKHNKPSTNKATKLKFSIMADKFTDKHIYIQNKYRKIMFSTNLLTQVTDILA